MSSDPMDIVWRSADTESPTFAGDETASWKPGLAQSLEKLGFLRPGKTATHVTCDACADGHTSEVTTNKYSNGRARFFIVCPENGRIEVEREHLLQWSVDFAPALKAIADGLGVKTTAEELVPRRVWKLGRASLAGRSRVVWAARGLSWPDAPSLADVLPTGKSPILFFFGLTPTTGVVKLRPDAIIAARDVVRLNRDDLVFDLKAVVTQVSVPDAVDAKRPTRKRASRTAAIDAIKQALREHLRSARDHAYDLRDRGKDIALLPRPTMRQLADQLKLHISSVSRAMSDRADREISILWAAAEDLDQVMQFKG